MTEPARSFVEANYVPALEDVVTRLRRILAEGGRLEARKRDPLFTALASVLPPLLTDEELAFYRAYLRDGLHVKTEHSGRQQRFAGLLPLRPTCPSGSVARP